MITIGMIGADSTHTEAYAQLTNRPGGPLYGRAQVTKLWGNAQAQTEKKATECDIPQVVTTPDEAIREVDVVMVCNRYGDDHPPYARMALEAGIPTFIDKPFANDLGDAKALAQLATEHSVPLMSCSAIRYAVEVMALQEQLASFGPLNSAVTSGMATGDFPDQRAKHPFFYGIHPVELLHTLLGPGAESVTTQRTSRCDVGLVHYTDGRQGVINLLQETPSFYHAAVYGATGWGQFEIVDWENFYVETLAQVIRMAEAGETPYPIAWAVEVMAMMTALVQSAENGGKTIYLSDL
ncbi:MAG: Gfo/Idh/MocA family oxidoreductase [Chloroflexota bacterium]